MSFEWYHSVFCFHHRNHVGPTEEHLFGWVLDHHFHDSVTQKSGCEWWKVKTQFCYFQNSKPVTQWQVRKLAEIMGPMTCVLSSQTHSSPMAFSPSFFLLLFFPFLSFFLSSSDPLHHFHTCINLYPKTKTYTSFSWFWFLI